MAPRIAAVSDDLSSDFADAARVAAEAGLAGLAVRHVGGTGVLDLDTATLAALRRTANDHGLTISAVSSPIGRDLPLDHDPARPMALLRRALAAAEILDTPLVRVFAFWLPGRDALSTWADRDPVASAGRVAERLAPMVAVAEQAGVTLMVELEGASHVGRCAEARALVQAVDSPALAVCWDVCNGWWSGERPWPDGWQAICGLPIVDVQTKDVAARPGAPQDPTFTQVVLGDGDIPYDRILAALAAAGYRGWHTVERVYHPRRPEREPRLRADILADINRLRQLLSTVAASPAPAPGDPGGADIPSP